jgi:isopentenyl-diphosphate Delta-isomerase
MASLELEGAERLDAVERRKAEHQLLIATNDVRGSVEPGWSDIRLVHEALPEVDLEEIDLSVDFLGRRLGAPLLLAALTGGHAHGEVVNARLARAAERHGLAMGVGSQRAALRNPGLTSTYTVARREAPHALLMGNLGAAQLVDQEGAGAMGVDEVRQAVEMIDADAMAVHLNFVEEVVQPEGDRRAHGCLAAITRLARELEIPLVVKETGAGLSRTTCARLAGAGAAAIDVGGAGGTSYAVIEALRAKAQGDDAGHHLGGLLREWGVPTAVSVAAARPCGVPVIATGGVRSALDAAKAIAMGATLAGVSVGLLDAALASDEAVERWVHRFCHALRAILFLTGCRSPLELARRPRVVTGATRAWIDQLGYGEPAGGGDAAGA